MSLTTKKGKCLAAKDWATHLHILELLIVNLGSKLGLVRIKDYNFMWVLYPKFSSIKKSKYQYL